MAPNNKAMPVDQLMSKERAVEHYRKVLSSVSIIQVQDN